MPPCSCQFWFFEMRGRGGGILKRRILGHALCLVGLYYHKHNEISSFRGMRPGEGEDGPLFCRAHLIHFIFATQTQARDPDRTHPSNCTTTNNQNGRQHPRTIQRNRPQIRSIQRTLQSRQGKYTSVN